MLSMTLLLTAGLLCFFLGGVTFETMSSLNDNQLTDESGKEFATALKQNDTLTTLG